MIRAFLFDMDGLLVDTERLHLGTFADLATARGVPCRSTDLHVWIGKGQHRLASWIVEQAGEGTAEEVVAAQRAAFLQALLVERPGFLPGVRELLQEATRLDLPVGLVSNSDEEFVRATMAQALPGIGHSTEVEETFAVMVTRDHVAHPKPAPDPYLLAASLLGVDPGSCLVFEDSPSGARAARAAGCPVIGVPCAYLPDPDSMDPLVDRVFPSLLDAFQARVWEALSIKQSI